MIEKIISVIGLIVLIVVIYGMSYKMLKELY